MQNRVLLNIVTKCGDGSQFGQIPLYEPRPSANKRGNATFENIGSGGGIGFGAFLPFSRENSGPRDDQSLPAAGCPGCSLHRGG